MAYRLMNGKLVKVNTIEGVKLEVEGLRKRKKKRKKNQVKKACQKSVRKALKSVQEASQDLW